MTKRQKTHDARPEALLRAALAAGALRWLRVRDAVHVQSTCATLRGDNGVADCALVHCAREGRHFFQRCARDWFHVIRGTQGGDMRKHDEQPLDAAAGTATEVAAGDDDNDVGNAREAHDSLLRCANQHGDSDTNCSANSSSNRHVESCAQTLSTIGALERQMDAFQDGGAAQAETFRPLLVPLQLPPALATAASRTYDRLSAQSAADAVQRTSASSPLPVSPLGAHWDSISVDVSVCGTVTSSCALCTACVDAVCRYRDETETFASRFEELLTRQEALWERAGRTEADRCELAFNFQQAYYGMESFYSTYVADADDFTILRYLCARSKFTARHCEREAWSALEIDRGPLSLQSRARCRSFYRPLREFFARMGVANVRRSVVSAPASRSDINAPALELISGSTATVIVGIYVLSSSSSWSSS